LPEVVVISKDAQTLNDVRALQKYVLEELNVRTLTVTSDKETYGVMMRAEPEHRTLGSRLKGSFKAVTQAIKVFAIFFTLRKSSLEFMLRI
jgi:isoleucyl-tRNA synthetase